MISPLGCAMFCEYICWMLLDLCHRMGLWNAHHFPFTLSIYTFIETSYCYLLKLEMDSGVCFVHVNIF